MGHLAHRPHGGFCLREHDAGMIEEDPAGGGQFDSARAAQEKRGAHLMLEIADLAAQGGLGGVQLVLGGKLEASGLGHGDEVAKMSEFHGVPLLQKHTLSAKKAI